MSNDPQSEELQQIVDDLIQETRKGNFQWKSVNPTTYVWDGASDRDTTARLTLQRISQKAEFTAGLRVSQPSPYYVLQVSEITAQGVLSPKLSLSGVALTELNTKLGELYRLIRSGVTETGIQFFKGIVTNPQPKD